MDLPAPSGEDFFMIGMANGENKTKRKKEIS